MKTLVVAIAILGSSLFGSSYAHGSLNINDELKKVIKFENNELPIKKNETEFVKVSFIINEDGKVEILEMNYSNENIKSQLIEKLSEIKIEQDHDSEEVYNYNFTFKKR
ncbi:MAG: hypothetical protein COA97_02005 [Flavobacteriales bacterium]|nr:MAG: hypothetical protein COA97_02005 [Flavobacteriales bacterium]